MVVVGIGLLQANAQSTFNRRYDSFGQALIQDAWSIEERSDSGYFVVHMSNYQENPGLYLLTAVLALDVEGAVDTVTRVPLTPKSVYCGWANCSDRTNDGGFVIGGTYGNIGDTLRALLIKFDVAGNYEWTRDFLPSGFEWLGRQAKETSDGGYVVCGETSANLGNQNDGFLIKTDANGELEWVQTYNGGGGNDYFVSVDLCGVNDFYLGGERSVSVSNLDFWVQRVNSSGVSVWTRSWGGPFHEPNAHLIATADGHALVASGWATANEEYRLYMAKLDSANGSTIWQRTYGPPLFSNVLFAAKEVAPGGDLIGTGQSYSGGDLSGIMLRTTSAGDSLWLRYTSTTMRW